MSMATTKPPDLVSCSDQDFNNGIVGLSLKELLGTISILQKEMTREQENFNSLSSELNSLNKNSRQYKQIQKEMTTSQGRLTSLMNRSMKCFQQQGNHHVTRPDRDSPAEEKEITVKDQTDRVPLNSKPTVVVQNGESEKISHSSSVQQQNEQSGKQLSSVIVVGHTQQNGELTKEKSSIVSTKVNVNYPNMAGAGNNVKPNIENKENITHNSNTKLGDTVSRNQSSDVTKPSTFKSSVSVMSVTPRSTVAENSSSALSERSSEQKSDEAKTVVKAPTNVNKTAPPAVVYHMGRPIAVDQNVGQNRDQMMEQIRNFKRKSDTVPDVVKPEDKVKKEVFSSETLNADHTEKKQEKIQTTEAVDDDHDSGAEDGSGEASPEVEKYVSSFSFPQKAKPEPTKVQDINRQEQVTPAVQSHLEVVPEESNTSNTQPSVDRVQQSQVLSSSPKCQDAPLDLNHEDGATCVKALREATDNLSRTRLKTRGLPIEISDHFLAECFDPKYNFQERIALIRKKLWGDSPTLMKSERGKPDGASNTETVSKCNTEDSAKQSENTKTM